MDNTITAQRAVAYTAWILLQLLNAPQAVYLPPPSEEEEDTDPVENILNTLGEPVDDAHAHM